MLKEDGNTFLRRSMESQVHNNRVRVLVVDDDPTIRTAFNDLISGDEEFELVGSAANAAEAVGSAFAQRPDVVLLDFLLPGGGPDAARAIRQRSPGTGIVAISAYEDRRSMDLMMKAGAALYLVKGRCTTSEILSALKQAAEGE
jgi:DNA-binding NarL/FixJ family response regulator